MAAAVMEETAMAAAVGLVTEAAEGEGWAVEGWAAQETGAAEAPARVATEDGDSVAEG